MLLALLLSYLARLLIDRALGAPTTQTLGGNGGADPISACTAASSVLIEPALPTQTPFANHRSVEDIVWSCIGTMVACSWASVHPNMQGFRESKVSMHLRHLAYAFWAIVAPEAMIFWAMRQWHGARVLEKEFMGEGWTMTHGHFLQMGGFVLEIDGKKESVLDPKDLRMLIDKGRIKLADLKITKAKIDELSKTSVLARALAVIQILWFSLQCIARHIEGLPITNLELTTAALGAINGALYICWSEKPFQPLTTISIPVIKKDDDKDINVCVEGDPEPGEGENDQSWQIIRKNTIFTSKDEHFEYVLSWKLIWIIFIEWPKRAFLNVYHNLGSVTGRWKPHVYDDRVSSFYAYPIEDVKVRYFTNFCACVVGLVFAGIHCAGWNFIFPKPQEQILWRVCSVTIFSVPLAIFCFSGAMKIFRYYMSKKPRTPQTIALMVIFFIPAAIGWIALVALIPMYILARLGLLVEAFFSLRKLEPGTLNLVKWSTFIPHV